MNKPVTPQELIASDKRLEVVKLQGYAIPEMVVWQAGKQDYSEDPVYCKETPLPSKCGEWVVEQLLANERGHYGPLEHPHLTLNVCGFVHSVMVQARTHRVGISFDVQSQRYTGKRVQKVANGLLGVEDVFYLRPEGHYIDRQGDRYFYSEADRQEDMEDLLKASKKYDRRRLHNYNEEHIRDMLPQAIRQHFVVTMNLRSVLHFMDLRAKKDAQLEIQTLCELIWPIVKQWAPNVCKYYEEKRLHRARLSP